MDVTIEHRIPSVSSIPSVEGIVGQYQSGAISQILLLVVLYLHELTSEPIIMQELIVVVAQYQVLLTLQVIQQSDSCLHIMNRHIAENEYVVVLLHNPIPVLHNPIVKLLRPIQLVAGEGDLILSAANGA